MLAVGACITETFEVQQYRELMQQVLTHQLQDNYQFDSTYITEQVVKPSHSHNILPAAQSYPLVDQYPNEIPARYHRRPSLMLAPVLTAISKPCSYCSATDE
jgi:hypothetical protein